MMEGGCSKVLGTETKPAEFDANEIPMSHESWKTNLNNNHPICDMTYSFVKEILHMHNRTCCSNLFIAYDGRGNIISLVVSRYMLSSHHRLLLLSLLSLLSLPGSIDEYIKDNATVLVRGRFDDIDNTLDVFHKKEANMGEDTKFLEMFLAIHSDFFIMNPRSTFSFEVYVIRTILGLHSVPVMRNKDFFLKGESTISAKDPRWVTFESIVDTVLALYRGMIDQKTHLTT